MPGFEFDFSKTKSENRHHSHEITNANKSMESFTKYTSYYHFYFSTHFITNDTKPTLCRLHCTNAENCTI